MFSSKVSRSIPPLNPLHVFEVAARLGNFTKAAEELNVTQSAVSRQIGTLENFLKVRLFHRGRTGVSLTKIGKSYFREIEAAFSAIASSTAQVLKSGAAQQLHVCVYPTFAVKWLVPRMEDFNSRYPVIEVRVTTNVHEVDFVGENVDLAIRLLPDSDAEPRYIKLFTDVIQPVCSPALLESGRHCPVSIEALGRFRLLHSRYRRADWRDWLSAMGVEDIADRGIEFPSSVLTYQAAVEGLGVAMGQIRLLEHDLGSGRLVPLFDRQLERPMSYYVVWPKNTEPNYKARAFIHWLQRQAGGHDASAPLEQDTG